MRLTIEIDGFKVNLTLPDDTTHLSRNHIESIEDCMALARRGPQPMPEGLVLGEFKPWDGYDKWAEANPEEAARFPQPKDEGV